MPPFSGLFDNEFSDGPHTLQFNRSSVRRNISRLFRKVGVAKLRELMLELTGTAAGASALATRTRIVAPADSDDIGGVRLTEVIDKVNRVTAAADETDIDTKVLVSLSAIAPASYPVDASGNGGGGKGGF